MHDVICIYTTYATVNVSRASLSAMSKADMKSNDTVTDGFSKGLTIGKSASRRQEENEEKKGRTKGEEIRMLIIFVRLLLA